MNRSSNILCTLAVLLCGISCGSNHSASQPDSVVAASRDDQLERTYQAYKKEAGTSYSGSVPGKGWKSLRADVRAGNLVTIGFLMKKLMTSTSEIDVRLTFNLLRQAPRQRTIKQLWQALLYLARKHASNDSTRLLYAHLLTSSAFDSATVRTQDLLQGIATVRGAKADYIKQRNYECAAIMRQVEEDLSARVNRTVNRMDTSLDSDDVAEENRRQSLSESIAVEILSGRLSEKSQIILEADRITAGNVLYELEKRFDTSQPTESLNVIRRTYSAARSLNSQDFKPVVHELYLNGKISKRQMHRLMRLGAFAAKF